MTKIRKAVTIILLAVFFSGLAWFIYVDQFDFMYLPRVPDAKSGRTNKIVVSHGSVRYATNAEAQRLHRSRTGFFVFAMACGAVAGLLNFWYDDFSLPTAWFRRRNEHP